MRAAVLNARAAKLCVETMAMQAANFASLSNQSGLQYTEDDFMEAIIRNKLTDEEIHGVATGDPFHGKF